MRDKLNRVTGEDYLNQYEKLNNNIKARVKFLIEKFSNLNTSISYINNDIKHNINLIIDIENEIKRNYNNNNNKQLSLFN